MASISISVFSGAEIAIVDANHPDCLDELVIRKPCDYHEGGVEYSIISLGNATVRQLTAIQEYLERLKIHCSE